jgi:DNA adenine methylase
MRYFGGKTRICKEIACFFESIREPNQVFLSAFVGGGWVESLMKDPKICCDKHNYLIDMYKAIQNGWFPPKNITKEEYKYIKDHKDEKPYLTGFVGFGCSFAGKWFGGYAKESSDRNFCLNAYNSIMKKMDGFKNTTFDCKDYSELNPSDMLIYCDPPYFGTTQYAKQVVGDFDHNKFWGVVRKWSLNNIVMVSEYTAPEDFSCLWQKMTKLDIRDKDNKKLDRVEKIFTI